jgi:hypothetical protein
VSFAAITLCVTSQRTIPKASVYFVDDSIRKLLDTSSHAKANRLRRSKIVFFCSLTILACLHVRQSHGLVTSSSFVKVLAHSQWNHQLQLSRNTPSLTFLRQEPHLPDNSLEIFLLPCHRNYSNYKQLRLTKLLIIYNNKG